MCIYVCVYHIQSNLILLFFKCEFNHLRVKKLYILVKKLTIIDSPQSVFSLLSMSAHCVSVHFCKNTQYDEPWFFIYINSHFLIQRNVIYLWKTEI